MPPSAALLLLLALAPPEPGDASAVARIEASAGLDANPLRESDETRTVSRTDGWFTELVLDAHAAGRGDRRIWRASLSEGGRLFARVPDANVLATRAELAASAAAGELVWLGGILALRDLSEQGGVRSETGGRAAATARADLGPARVRASAGVSASFPRAAELVPFTAWGPDGTVAVALEPAEGHVVEVAYELRRRAFPRWGEDRVDLGQTASIDWAWRGAVVLGATYAFTANGRAPGTPAVLGATYTRHRVAVRVASPLPLGWTLAVLGSLQRSLYPDGVFIDAAALLAQNDEQQNALELRLSRPVSDVLEVALKAGVYGSELAGAERIPYDREVVQVALGWRFE